MERRQFIKLTGAGAASGLFGNNLMNISDLKKNSDLGYHKISDVKFSSVKLNYPRFVGKNSHLNDHGMGHESYIHILYTDKGASGWGVNRGKQKLLIPKIELLKGKTVAELIAPATGVISPGLEGFDFSLYDLAGRILDKPVYKLLGKRKPEIQRCYSGMFFFEDLEPFYDPVGTDRILEECLYDYNYGYRQFKLKLGRGYKWMDKEKGLQRDIEVTKLISTNFPDCDILVDGDNAFTIDEFLRYMEGIEGIKLFWIEEPFHETISDYARLNSWLRMKNMTPLLADGLSKPDEEVLKQLGSQKIVTVFLHDIVSLGFTRWIKFIRELSLSGILASPNAWGSAIKTNYIAHLSGAFGDTPTIEGVTCTSDDVDLTGYTLKKGKLIPSSKPGFGMDLLKRV